MALPTSPTVQQYASAITKGLNQPINQSTNGLNMKLPRIAIENHQFTMVMVLLLALFGLSAFITMPRSEDPQFKLPIPPSTPPRRQVETTSRPATIAEPFFDRAWASFLWLRDRLDSSPRARHQATTSHDLEGISCGIEAPYRLP